MFSAPITSLLFFLLVTAGAFVVLAVVYSASKFEQLEVAARSSGGRALPPREAFLLQIAGRMGLWRSNDARFSIALAEGYLNGGSTPVSGDECAAVLEANVRAGVDEVQVLDETRVGLILTCLPHEVTAIHRRCEKQARFRLRMGISSYPENGASAQELLEAAEGVISAAPVGAALDNSSPALAPEEEDGADMAPVDERMIDPLTGVLRRERVVPAALKYMARWRRKGQAVSLLHFDFDALDDVNTRYGRESGDAALRAMGRLVDSSVRETDLVGRLDDDEFLILVPTSAENAVRIGRRILNAYAAKTSAPGQVRVRGTVSVGVAEAPTDAREFPDLLECARLALLRGRRAGRSRCTRFTEELRKKHGASARTVMHERF